MEFVLFKKCLRWCWISFLLSVPVSATAELATVSNAAWDNTAVRKVLHTFAFGGFATDVQIQAWADMPAAAAVAEMLTFAPVNELLSPTEDVTPNYLSVNGRDSTLQGLQDWWFDAATDNLLPTTLRIAYHPVKGSLLRPESLQNTWIEATTKRGVNPFRQRVGFWLTNYLMSVHLGSVNNNLLLIRTMYDDVMRALAEDRPLAEVLAIGVSSAAISRQYGHMSSKIVGGQFSGNDDFAREYHQLVFGILGELNKSNPDRAAYKTYYENVTIEGTARMLTGMQLDRGFPYGITAEVFLSTIDFNSVTNTANHHSADLEILNFGNPGVANISGATAREKILALSRLAINDPESVNNFPVRIVQHFADDLLDGQNNADQRIIDIRATWSTSGKNLLAFIQRYAISTQFHSPARVKYLTAFERNMTIALKNSLSNLESYNHIGFPKSRMESQGAEVFRSVHFVFGGQTGRDAIESADIFKLAYNANVNNTGFLARAADGVSGWEKDWGVVIPSDGLGNHVVASAAEWLWRRFIADGGANYTIQERAYLSSLLNLGIDFPTHVANELGGVVQENGFSSADLLDPAQPYLALIAANEAALLPLNDTVARVSANHRVGMAVNFITTTPFMFVQTGGS